MSAPTLQVLDESIYDVLDVVRKSPGIYIAEPSINRLHAFLVGYTAGLGRVGFTLRDEDNFHRFHDWVARRLGFGGSTSGWCNMIRDKSTSEADQFLLGIAFGAQWEPEAGQIKLLAETHDPWQTYVGQCTTNRHALLTSLGVQQISADHVITMTDIPHYFALRGLVVPCPALSSV